VIDDAPLPQVSAQVVVVGSLNIDTLMRVHAIPRPGETVLASSVAKRHGGKGGNQASAAARLGARTSMIACVGPDDAGVEARDALRSAGVDVADLVSGDKPTGTALVLVDGDGENAIVVDPGANHELSPGPVGAALATHADAVVLISLEIPLHTALAAAESAARQGSTVILNPAPAQPLPRQLLAACDVVVANEHEVTQLGTGSIRELLDLGPRAVVVTSGRRGADIHDADGSVHHQPAFAVSVVDTTGAGDAFCGCLAWGLANGHDLRAAVRAAAAAGALATRAVGTRTSLPREAELAQLLTQR
jgi:ribokinase